MPKVSELLEGADPCTRMMMMMGGGGAKESSPERQHTQKGLFMRWKDKAARSDGRHWQELRLLLEVILL